MSSITAHLRAMGVETPEYQQKQSLSLEAHLSELDQMQLQFSEEQFSYTEEGMLDSIWNGIKAFFKAIGNFIYTLFTGKSKSSTNRVDSYLEKLKEFESKYGNFVRADLENWYPDRIKSTKASALKSFPDDAKLKAKIEHLETIYEKEVFKKHCAVMCLLPHLSIYGKLNSIVTAQLAGMPDFAKYKDAIKNQSNGQVVSYTPLKLDEVLPPVVYKSYVDLFKNSGEKLPTELGEVTEQLLKNALIGSLESQKLDRYGAIFHRCVGTHPIDIMKDYQQWIDRTAKDLPKVKKEIDDLVSKINLETPPGVATGLRQLGKDVNAQIIAINFIHTLLDGLIASSTYLLQVDSSICDLVEYTQTQAIKSRP